MQINDIIPPLLPYFNDLGNISVSQTLSAMILGSCSFFLLSFFIISTKKIEKIVFLDRLLSIFMN